MVDYEFIKSFSDLRQVAVVLILWMDQNTHTTESLVEQFGNEAKIAIAGLIDQGRLFVDEKGFLVLNNKPELTPIEQQVEAFRKAYPGTKPGLGKFMEILKKKKKWKDIVPQLMPALARELKHRIWLEQNNKFCPDMAMLTTWINQDRYTWEYDTPDNVPSDDSLYGRYLSARTEKYPSCQSLSETQFNEWVDRKGIFSKVAQKVPYERQKEWFWSNHSKNTYQTMKEDLEQ